MAQVARKNRRSTLLLLLLVGAILWVAINWGQRFIGEMLSPVDPGAQAMVELTVPAGYSTHQVAALLFEQGLIKDPNFFRYYARYRQLDGAIKSGEYELSAAMTPAAILERLTQGGLFVERFTLPEGLTVAMMADRLAAQGVVTRESFLAAVKAQAASNSHLPQGVALPEPMEGYLFPATYEYRRGAGAGEIVAMLFRRFEQVWDEPARRRAQELGLTIHEVITLASIIETEARVAAERPRIAGVYHNRLAIDMALQADPTVYYAIGLPRGEMLLYRHLEADSPFNTYKYPGLPPGPIGAPGEHSIRAALYPEQHDLFYFVAKEDGSGEHYFGRTLDEHNENVARARANQRR